MISKYCIKTIKKCTYNYIIKNDFWVVIGKRYHIFPHFPKSGYLYHSEQKYRGYIGISHKQFISLLLFVDSREGWLFLGHHIYQYLPVADIKVHRYLVG